MKFAILLSFVLILTGCSSFPTSSEAITVPSDRLLSNIKKSEKYSAEIIIIRDRSISGSACYYAIYINNKLAARIGSAEKAVFNLEPGQVLLKVTRDPQGKGLCSLGDDMTEQMISLGNLEKKHFRLSTSISGWPDLKIIQQSLD